MTGIDPGLALRDPDAGVVVVLTGMGCTLMTSVLVVVLRADPLVTVSSEVLSRPFMNPVGTDLVQAVPVVTYAPLGHLLHGVLFLALATVLLIASGPRPLGEPGPVVVGDLARVLVPGRLQDLLPRPGSDPVAAPIAPTKDLDSP